MNRFAVFIDAGYLSKVCSDFNTRLNFLKLSEEVSNGEERLRTYFFDCAPYTSPKPTDDEKFRKSEYDKFIYALQQEPRFMIRLGHLQKIRTEKTVVFRQKMVDVLFSLDLAKLALNHQIQRAVLFAGDSDYVPAIHIARDEGVVVQLYYYQRLRDQTNPIDQGFPRPHDELLNNCDDKFLIDRKFIDKVKI